ncbi:MAG: HAL/PAL/TAL family ammonia-lyase [Betaproteobacteria bacterium]
MESARHLIVLDGKSLTVEGLLQIAHADAHVSFAESVWNGVEASRSTLEAKLERNEVIYGVNTGFGGNVKFLIPSADTEALQDNLLNSLSCGTGAPFPAEVVRGAMLLRANALAKGFSAVRPLVLERLAALLNADIVPRVPRHGSVGASGDLIPSAYIARALLGQGDVLYRGEAMAAAEAMKAAGIEPIALKAKEGLALVNGTTVMTSLAALTVADAEHLARLCVYAVGLACEALNATTDSFHEQIQEVKSHPGQKEVGRMLRACTSGSALVVDLESARERIRHARGGAETVSELEESIQTPYSLRCAPQGLGPAFDTLAFARQVVEREMNSVNDNPLLDGARDAVYHTGNFYGGHIARVMDGVKIDLANLANWAHALMAMLMDPRFSRGLPANLADRPGLQSGFKGMQISQTSLVVACRQMAAPSSVHTLPTEQYNQDIVSLGLHAALSAADMARLVRDALSILVLALCQAADLRGVSRGERRLGAGTAKLYEVVRRHAAYLDADRPLDGSIAKLSLALRKTALAV